MERRPYETNTDTRAAIYGTCKIPFARYGILPSIKQGLEAKLDDLVMRDLYSKYKTAPTKEERERARKEYLDRRVVLESFRW